MWKRHYHWDDNDNDDGVGGLLVMRKQKAYNSPSALMQRGAGPRTLDGLFLDGSTLFASPPPLGRADIGADTALEAQVGGRCNGNGGAQEGTTLARILPWRPALVRILPWRHRLVALFTGTGGGTGGYDSPLARMQRGGGPRTLDGLFIDGGTLFTQEL